MALYAMSDLHLSKSSDKPMDVFGCGWIDYTERIYSGWRDTVSDDDTVIVGGDISWAMYLEEAKADFEFLDSLPGHKILMRGNHDYWWMSLKKLNKFLEDNDFSTIEFMQNNAVLAQGYLIVGTRGWILPGSSGFGTDDEKIYNRELIRLSLSLKSAKEKLNTEQSELKKLAVFHYPPVDFNGKADENILSVLKENKIDRCIYGHLHSYSAKKSFNGISDGIDFRLVSADYLNFTSVKI